MSFSWLSSSGKLNEVVTLRFDLLLVVELLFIAGRLCDDDNDSVRGCNGGDSIEGTVVVVVEMGTVWMFVLEELDVVRWWGLALNEQN